MFEDLKARRTGRTPRESRRLWTTLSLAALCGAVVFGSRACRNDAPEPLIRPVVRQGEPETRALDMKPLERLKTSPPDPRSFDKEALDHVVVEVRTGAVRRAPDRRLDLADVLALDPAQAVGTLVETTGTVASLDTEEYSSKALPNVDQLWGFSLETEPTPGGPTPARILVVHASSTLDPEHGRPLNAARATGTQEPIGVGDHVHVRGYYLQRRTGDVGGVKGVERPTPVLVGREYRITFPELPSISSPDLATYELVRDRTRDETRTLNDQAIYELLVWSRKRGAARLADDLRSGALPFSTWGSARFISWGRQIEADDLKGPDSRSVTLEARGKVFSTTGLLVHHDHEDWEHVPKNLYGVDERWKYWFVSDFYANVPFLVDSAFPITDFPGIREPDPARYQRVRLYGVFVKVHSYEPAKGYLRGARDRNPVVTVPYFVLVGLESDESSYRSAPLVENPFFWTGVSLAVFLVGFFLVMTRMERRESAAMDAHRIRLRRGSRPLVPPAGDPASDADAPPPAPPPSP